MCGEPVLLLGLAREDVSFCRRAQASLLLLGGDPLVQVDLPHVIGRGECCQQFPADQALTRETFAASLQAAASRQR